METLPASCFLGQSYAAWVSAPIVAPHMTERWPYRRRCWKPTPQACRFSLFGLGGSDPIDFCRFICFPCLLSRTQGRIWKNQLRWSCRTVASPRAFGVGTVKTCWRYVVARHSPTSHFAGTCSPKASFTAAASAAKLRTCGAVSSKKSIEEPWCFELLGICAATYVPDGLNQHVWRSGSILDSSMKVFSVDIRNISGGPTETIIYVPAGLSSVGTSYLPTSSTIIGIKTQERAHGHSNVVTVAVTAGQCSDARPLCRAKEGVVGDELPFLRPRLCGPNVWQEKKRNENFICDPIHARCNRRTMGFRRLAAKPPLLTLSCRKKTFFEKSSQPWSPRGITTLLLEEFKPGTQASSY